MDEALMGRWKQRDKHRDQLFISDGVVDSALWRDSPVKILFLLKEAYSGPGEHDWDLRQYVRDRFWKGTRHARTWWTMAQWAYGVRHLLKGRVAPFPGDSEHKAVDDALLGSAVVNIKKSCGQGSSNLENLRQYAQSDWDLLSEQIEGISPEIVICGYTWPVIRGVLGMEGKAPISEWVYEARGTYWVDFWHPANRYPQKMNYYSLCTAIHMSGVMGRMVR